MREFKISRINTCRGTLRLAGKYHVHEDGLQLLLQSLFVMGTDGWEELQIDHTKTEELICAVTQELSEHIVKHNIEPHS